MKAFHFSFPKCAGGHKLCCLFYLSLPVHALACKMHLRESSEGWPHNFVSFILKHSLLFWEALYPSNIRFSGWLGVWTWLVHRPGILNKEEFAWESQPLGESCSKSVIEYTSAMVKSWIIYIHDMYVYIYAPTLLVGWPYPADSVNPMFFLTMTKKSGPSLQRCKASLLLGPEDG